MPMPMPMPSPRFVVEMRRSFPRPLMPLLLFLYRVAKYSHNSRSCGFAGPCSVEKRCVRVFRVFWWNLFWWDWFVLVYFTSLLFSLLPFTSLLFAMRGRGGVGWSGVEWVVRLTLRLPSCVKFFPQSSRRQVKGFAWRCVVLWARTLPRWAKRLWHSSHS